MTIKTIFVAAAIFVLSLPVFGQNDALTDPRNNITYETVTIGKQVWMAENLEVFTFLNGDSIPNAESEEAWVKAAEEGKPACTWYMVDETSGLARVFYNWFAVTDPRGLAPKGWHIPAENEWNALASQVGGKEVAMQKLKSKEIWAEEAAGTNESGFNGLPLCRLDQEGFFDDSGLYSFFWSSSEKEGFGINVNLSEENFPFEPAQSFKGSGLSVRCVKD